ncbi:PrsW family glutamic-type intramembrane protease [uncultured Thermanaerothrix sp.]|uniref:PrsW family glutamic-type intramembrane protease n=1 Tax=uncultured Thermanaerothrix sp. TaxID=1195149 RepID=UPI00261340FA|nr:PrsW family glutamic-type intramembrane protease [uncultured Thermanaerothrix sp.]
MMQSSSGSSAPPAWQSVLFLVFSSLGTLLGLGGAALLAFLGLLALLAGETGSTQQATSALSLAATALLVALLCLPGVIHAYRAWRGRTRPMQPLGRGLPWLTLGVLAWPLLVGLYGVLETAPAAWLILPPLIVLSALLPLLWFLYLGAHGLALDWESDAWGVISTSLVITMPLILVVEVGLFLVLAVGAFVWVAARPELAQQLQDLVRTLETVDPRVLETYLQDVFAQPEVLSLLLLLVAGAIPLIEELFKPLAVWTFAGRQITPAQGYLIGLLAGACFALLENLSALSGVAGLGSLPTLVGRVGTGLLHMTTTGLVGWSLASAWQGRSSWRVLGAYLLAVCLHGLWNAFGLLMGIGTLFPVPPSATSQLAHLSALAPIILGILAALNFVFILAANRHFRREAVAGRAGLPPATE